MKNYLTLVSMNFKYVFKSDGRKKSKWLWLAYVIVALSFLALLSSLCFGVFLLGKMFAPTLLPEFITFLYGVGCIMIVVLGIAPMISYLYFSKDTEFLLGLPLKPVTVFFAKLTVVYIFEMLGGALFLLPSLITLGVTLKLSALYYIGTIISIFLLPALPMVLVSVLSLPLMRLVGVLKNKSIVAFILYAVLMVAVMGLYLGVMYSFDFTIPEGDDGAMATYLKLEAAVKAMAKILVPLLAVSRILTLSPVTILGSFSTPVAVLINLATFLVITAALVLIAILISSFSYKKSARSLLEGSKNKASKKVEFSRSSSVIKALMKKEWLELIRTPAFAFQCLMCIVMAPLMVGFMAYFDASNLAGEYVNYTSKFIMRLVSFGIIIIIGIGTNVGASTTITREGQKFYYMKTMPVPYETQIKAKLYLYLIVSSVTVILSQVVMAIISFDIVFLTVGTAFLLLFNYGFNCYCIYIDLNNPKLNWVTENEAVKQNKSAMIPILTNLAVYVLVTLIGTLCSLLIPNIVVAQIIIWSLYMLIGLVVTVIFHNLLFANAKRLIERITH